MFGRGSTDDKGPIMGWINVLEAHHTLNLPLPVNLRFCFEGMEESGSEGLDDFIIAEVKKPQGWFSGVDCVCIVCLLSLMIDLLQILITIILVGQLLAQRPHACFDIWSSRNNLL
jgi:hypothetical protein